MALKTSATPRAALDLAFKAVGEYLMDDPGPMRGIKITEAAPSAIPNIDGHNSPKMVHKVSLPARCIATSVC